MSSYPSQGKSTIIFIFLSVLLFLFIFSIVNIYFYFNYETKYQVIYNNEIIGYINDESEFRNAFYAVSNRYIINEQTKTYLEYEPEFYKVYKKNNTDISNIYSFLQANLKIENTIYYVVLDNKQINVFYEYEKAKEYSYDINKYGYKSYIKEDKTDKNDIYEIAIDRTYQDIISRGIDYKKSLKGLIPLKNYSYISQKYHFGHKAWDFAVNEGTMIIAWNDGQVVCVGWDYDGYGNYIDILHKNHVITRYAHGSKVLVKEGDYIKKGEAIMLSGNTGMSTGPHLHFEIIKNGVKLNPFNKFE